MTLDQQALLTATRLHCGQTRKGRRREPFIDHPVRVAGILEQHGLTDPALLAAAFLHDVLEDTPFTPDELEDAFGEEICSIVQEVTDRKDLLKSLRKQYQVERAPVLSLKARLIRLADKIDNLASLINDPPDHWPLRRQREYLAWARRVVRGIRDTHPGLVRQFDETAQKVESALYPA